MLQDKATSKANFERFIRRVRETREVWGLELSEVGWAKCPSNELEGSDVLTFWSDRAYAIRHVKDQWSAYVPRAIRLDEFIDSWLKGMHHDGVLVGPNWDANLCGLEVLPAEVARRLLEDP